MCSTYSYSVGRKTVSKTKNLKSRLMFTSGLEGEGLEPEVRIPNVANTFPILKKL